MKNLDKDWKFKELKSKDKQQTATVFGTFVCGGGSTMGYKLAGFNHLGGVEIDKNMAEIYTKNHAPKYFYLEDIRDFNQREDLPKELFNLDILDGSPPCTSFSLAGKREKGWGVKKFFKEGQKKQTLDDLVFIYCETIAKLRPKVAILENVKGIVIGNARKYAIGIVERLQEIGYDVQIFSLNSATMGVPQSRERVFFIARRKDLNFPPLVLNFDEKPIPFGEIVDRKSTTHEPLIPSIEVRLPFVQEGEYCFKYADMRYRNLKTINAFFSTQILYDDRVAPTLTSSGESVYWHEKRNINDTEYRRMSTFPSDFDFGDAKVRHVCGMSVPPLMAAKIAEQIKWQWFESNNKLNAS